MAMLKPLDVYDDVNFQAMYAIDKLVGGLPNFVKNAAVADHDDIKNLPPETFGDVVRRKFPCHTKQATFLSNAYFQQSRDKYPTKEASHVQARIDDYAKFWQISSLTNQFNKHWTKISSFNADDGSLPDSDFALVAEFDGHKIRRFPMPNLLGIKMAAESLYANRFMYPYPWRKEAAIRILARAEKADKEALEKKAFTLNNPALRINDEAHQYLQRATGLGMTHPQVAAEKVAQRWLMIKNVAAHVGYAEKLAELVQVLHTMAPQDMNTQTLEKCASLIDIIDQETGIAKHYADGVDMPEEMFFDMLSKEAEAILDQMVTLQTGSTYPIGLFASLPLEKIAAVMGKDFSDAVTDLNGQIDPVQFADIAATLPALDACVMERAIKCAVEEAHTKMASRDPKLMTYGTRAGIKKEMEARGAEEDGDEGNFSFTYKLKNYDKNKTH